MALVTKALCPIHARFELATPFSVPNNTFFVPIPWDTVKYDTNSFFDASYPGIIKINSGGRYEMSANGIFAANAAGVRAFSISIVSPQMTICSNNSTNLGGFFGNTHSVGVLSIELAAGDEISVYAYQNSGAPLNIGVGNHYTSFSIEKKD